MFVCMPAAGVWKGRFQRKPAGLRRACRISHQIGVINHTGYLTIYVVVGFSPHFPEKVPLEMRLGAFDAKMIRSGLVG